MQPETKCSAFQQDFLRGNMPSGLQMVRIKILSYFYSQRKLEAKDVFLVEYLFGMFEALRGRKLGIPLKEL